uniref:t-SNARE coiled-coil homology domain-containing protein n=1 Tax=Acrobeloides nanus TaxID=290746 RepID=A0A914CL35_9BILA
MILTKQRAMMEKIKTSKGENTENGVVLPQLSQFQQQRPMLNERTNSPNFLIFCRSTREILVDITELRNLVLEKRRDYILCGGSFSSYGYSNFMSDSDRQKFDMDSETVMNQCWKLIRSLESQLSADKSLRLEDELPHLQAVVYLLNIYLKEVCRIIGQIREIYLKKARQVQKICRLANLVEMYESNLATIKQEEEAKASKLKAIKKELDFKTNIFEQKDKLKLYNDEGWEETKLDDLFDDHDEEWNERVRDAKVSKAEKLEAPSQPSTSMTTKESSGVRQRRPPKQPKPLESNYFEEESPQNIEVNLTDAERTQLQYENEQLYSKFAQKNSEIETIARQIEEIRKLQDTFSEHILEQEQTIDRVHEKTVYTLDTLEAANDFIRQAIKNSASRRGSGMRAIDSPHKITPYGVIFEK